EANRGAFFFQSLGSWPVGLVLNDDKLRDPDAGQFQRPAIAGCYREVTTDDARCHLRGLDGDLQSFGTGGGEVLEGGAVGMLSPDGDIDACDARAVEKQFRHLAGLAVWIIVAERDQYAERLRRFLCAEWADTANLGTYKGIARAKQQLGPTRILVGLLPRSQERVD